MSPAGTGLAAGFGASTPNPVSPMPLEIEKKYLDVDFDALRAGLLGLGARRQGRHFERNLVFDRPDDGLLAQKKLLRLRMQQWSGVTRCILTFKAPARAVAGFKAREERECQVGDFADMAAVLEGLGYHAVAEYQKVRESWHCPGVAVELDRVPFANVLELEGQPGLVESLAARLGLDKYESCAKTYHELHSAWRKERGLPAEASFVFGADELKSILRELA